MCSRKIGVEPKAQEGQRPYKARGQTKKNEESPPIAGGGTPRHITPVTAVSSRRNCPLQYSRLKTRTCLTCDH